MNKITTVIYPKCLLNNLSNDGRPVGGWSVGCWAVWGRSIRSRCRHNNWSWSISWGWSIGWGRGISGLSRVFDISNVSSVGIRGVGNSL
jgi:hypothetical protein